MHSIAVENVFKDFRIYERPQDRLLELLLRKQRHKNFHVLQDISFSVLEGRSSASSATTAQASRP